MKKIFIGPIEIAGYYSNLEKGLKELGISCDHITYYDHRFGYNKGEAKVPLLIRITKFFNNKKNADSSFISKVLIAFPGEFFSAAWAIYAIFKYDIFIFTFGRSLIRFNIDMYLLNILNKKVISNLSSGSEARPPYIDGGYQDINLSSYPNNIIVASAKKIKKIVVRHERLATYIVGHSLSTSHFSSNKFINSTILGIPFQIDNEIVVNKSNKSTIKANRFFRILHSPSNPKAKGTNIIKKAIENLLNKGYKIDLILIENKSNAEVIEEIKKCDFVVDQVYSDFPLAGFATEAAYFGKPAIVGGYGLEYLKSLTPAESWPPSKICHPDEIENMIEDLLLNNEELFSIGEAAQNFVRSKWNAIEVAKRYLRIIDDDIPDNWWVDPKEVFYIEGAGQSLNVTKSNIQNIIKKNGIKGLQLRHNPKLEEAFLKFSK
jgi:glycosyltransferase involved in cell wall biosynthesis